MKTLGTVSLQGIISVFGESYVAVEAHALAADSSRWALLVYGVAYLFSARLR